MPRQFVALRSPPRLLDAPPSGGTASGGAAIRTFSGGMLLALPEALLLERADRLRTLSFFSFMTDEQLVAVARIAGETYTNAGTYLCRQGQLGQELFIVLKGEIEIIRRVEGARVVSKAREGQVVGESAILADTPRTADPRALTNVHLLVISGVQFRALIRQHAEIAENVIRHLVTKLEIS